jgi:hypothetical protein
MQGLTIVVFKCYQEQFFWNYSDNPPREGVAKPRKGRRVEKWTLTADLKTVVPALKNPKRRSDREADLDREP